MKIPSSGNSRNHKGIALITVVVMLALMMVLVVAILSLSESELKSAYRYSSGQKSRDLGNVAVNIVISQLRKASTDSSTDLAGRGIWTSQPGVARRYGADGKMVNAYKLYSSSQMITGGSEADLLKDVPLQSWQKQPLRYADLNRPVWRTDAGGTPRLMFPVVDPRAMTGAKDSVRGFAYSEKLAGGQAIDGVQTTGGDEQRLPMPVEWIYVLKDGNLGVLDAANTFVGSVPATESNPIVGRIAFWTDDESGKININTASESTFWALPTFFHQQDGDWARYQPVNGEFQRYPGHPATTALSPVLFPDKDLTWQDKDLIYDLVPKIGPGGTHSATKSYDDPGIAAIQFAQFRKEHLYANLDEMLLKNDRTENNFGDGVTPMDRLRRAGFFLTAHSKSPETNPFGLPKIAMWPVSYRGKDFRTAYDGLIAFCATLSSASGKRAYLFQRGYADSTTADVTYADNQTLLNWLLSQWKNPVPGFGGTSGKSFSQKYAGNLPQILVEMFDYIRSTNLYDGNLVAKPASPPDATSNTLLGYTDKWTRPTDYKTFTDPRFTMNGTDPETGQVVQNEYRGLPGHGQVTPSQWMNAGVTYQGIARFPTISEAGLHFIVCADNTNDVKNPFPKVDDTIGKAGGGSAPKLNSTDNNTKDRWYSNFPPNPSPDPSKGQKPNLAKYPKTEGFPYGKDPAHPGYNSLNWNWQLVANTPLTLGKRRVQARLLFEFFTPAAGYTIIEPEFSVRVSGLSSFKLNGQPLFPNDVEIVRTGRKATHNGVTQTGGYSMGVKGILREREMPARDPMPEDNQWGAAAWQVKPSSDTPATLSVLNYDLVSNFVDIDVGADGTKAMTVSNGALQVEIYSNHLGKIVSPPEVAAMKVQTLPLNFPSNTVKPPTLIRNPIVASGNSPAVEPPYWWSFYGKGCMGFSVTKLNKGTAAVIGGRYTGTSAAPQINGEPRIGAFFYGFDAVASGAPRIFRPQQSNPATQSGIEAAEEAEGSDVVQTLIVKHGDYRLTSAMPVVDAAQWKPHRYWGVRRLAHNFSNQTSNQMPGYDYGGDDDLSSRLVPNTGANAYATNRIPDFPYFSEASTAAHRYGDFDNAFGPERDGPYINKPDDGSLGDSTSRPYFVDVNKASSIGGTFFTPNRQIPSPVMFGSLPTGVRTGDAWRTLLFRPQQKHPGGPSGQGGVDPPDHLFLEFFWMPVVEPYAVSEPFATSGKINLNYQILPFTNIRRATGLHAVLQNELVTAVDEKDMADYKRWPNASDTSNYWKDSDGKTWHYKIDVEKTLAQFDERFAKGAVFKTPSEICEIHLVPRDAPGVTDSTHMAQFWSTRRLTGDNIRERPYSTIYPRLTTRSNTFRVHFLAQSVQKARSTAPDQMTDKDAITSEQRGSSLIERYVDPAQKTLPDFATSTNSTSLDAAHRFRILETKKFGS